MVVVKGIGIVTSLGQGKSANLERLRQRRTGIKKIKNRLMAGIENISIPEKLASMPRIVQFGYLAMKEAIEDAGLTAEEISSPETGLLFSSSKGDLSCLGEIPDEHFWERFSPGGVSVYLARLFNLRGFYLSPVAACATGIYIIAKAKELLMRREIRRVIAGASEAPLVPLLLAGYNKMGVLSDSEMCPFDRKRDGFVLGEGAVCIVLEREGKGIASIQECALGSLEGIPYRFDLKGDALAMCIRKLVERTFSPDYINTHGTATVPGDVFETIQIKKAIGRDAYKIPISSTKSMTGHLLGVSGLLEFVLTILSIRDGFIPGTIGLRDKDPECDLNYFTDNIPGNFHKFLVTSYGFGGSVACIAGEI